MTARMRSFFFYTPNLKIVLKTPNDFLIAMHQDVFYQHAKNDNSFKRSCATQPMLDIRYILFDRFCSIYSDQRTFYIL